ncbi:hypothetical protein [Nocardiopsis metallicus]|uniref:Putative membrane protein YesL n=1 Tax=Nocardiopsis metallicus TaxID=179819 RepID=A0A840W2J4_9ACTN|nr:hypothetical protein [Nocardiopsis metallicus]MBB5489503.1 putative membrane protein YesL [Nocardiopsis metallicus]
MEAGAPASTVLSSVGLMLLAALCWLTPALLSFRPVSARARTGNGAVD